VAFKEYPHTDILERALELVDLCAAKFEGRIHPVPSVVDCQMIVTMHTSRDPARAFVDRIMALEGKDGILSISISHGFAWGDVPEMGTKVLVYSDARIAGGADKGATLARTLAGELIAMREALTVAYPGIDDSLDAALTFEGGPVVLADGADNPGGGAAADATFVLERMLERGIKRACLGPLWDPIAVRIAFDAGVGATLMLRIGGKISPLSGDPLDLQVTVKALRADMFMTGLSNTPTAMGDCALVEAAGVQIMLCSTRNQAMGTDVFTNLGVNLAAMKIIVVKSSQHFYAAFSKVAQHVIYVGAPGAVTLDLRTLPYKKIRRPKWPIDSGESAS
jgi:microcystin degradation protein MlrC